MNELLSIPQTLLDKIPPQLHLWILLALFAGPYLTRAYHALAVGGGLRGIWAAIWFGTNTPAAVPVKVNNLAQPATPVDSTKSAPSVALVLPVILGALLFTSCATTQNTPGRVLASTVQTVDAAMQGWWTFEALGHATPDQVQKVRAAYASYQAAEAVAEVAYRAAANSPADQSAWQTAGETLRAAQVQLLALISQFTPPAGSPPAKTP